VDLGTGAGFPGLPLAIVWPTCAVSLVEARERRHHFQRTAIREIGIPNATPLLGRAEDLDPTPHAVVVAQAMAEPTVALGWMRRWVGASGWLAIPRSAGADPFEPPPGVFHVETRAYRVPCGGPARELWIGRLEADA
jgi:16S rRNA (guanine527-N7)-methyltransferase